MNGAAIVTGGASGIGEAIVERLLSSGHSVVAADCDAARLAEFARRVASDQLHTIEADISSNVDVARIVDACLVRFGELRYLVNSAGITSGPASFEETDPNDFDVVGAVNLKGTFLAMRAAIPAMRSRGGGAIVNIASSAGLRPIPMGTPYTASKWGVVGITMTAALEYASHAIRINAVCPGVIDTPMFQTRGQGHGERIAAMTPIGRLGRSEEIAAAAVWLLSDEASYVTGAILPVDGGLTLV